MGLIWNQTIVASRVNYWCDKEYVDHNKGNLAEGDDFDLNKTDPQVWW